MLNTYKHKCISFDCNYIISSSPFIQACGKTSMLTVLFQVRTVMY